MVIIPYSTALTLAKPPVVTYATTLICVLVFYLQLKFSVTESLMYYPESWNPVKMITSSLAHGGWMHLIGNMIFYLAFAPALEILLANKIRYIWIMLFVSFVVGVSYSVSSLFGSSEPLPSLGFSGVVMGMIGLSAYLMPMARIRVFWWYIVFWKTFYVPAWVLAIAFIGLDSWEMLTSDNYGGINVVAHVFGGVAGYLYGYLWLKERKEETQEELAEEIEVMKSERQFRNTPSMSIRGRAERQQQREIKRESKEYDVFMGQIYKMVITHRNSSAVNLLMDRYDYEETQVAEFETLFSHIEKWGPSRTLLCIGRLIIDKLDQEKRYGRAIVFIEKCQKTSPFFILADLSRTIYYARLAVEMDKPEVARNLVVNPAKRYGVMVDNAYCDQISKTLDTGIG